MTISPELMSAILAMNSYDQGYEAGIATVGPEIGLAQLLTDSTEYEAAFAPASYQTTGFYAECGA